jgi:hypothetical protein
MRRSRHLLACATAVAFATACANPPSGTASGAPSATISPKSALSSLAPQVVAASTPTSVIVGKRCVAAQLAAQLEDFEEGGDSNYGWLIIRDTGATDCQLMGYVGIIGLDEAGSRDTMPATAVVAGGLLLTARGGAVPVSSMPPAGEQVAFLTPGSSDSIATGPRQGADCLASDEVVPAAFRVDLDGVAFAVVRNGDPRSSPALDHLSICQGRFDALGPALGEPS